MEALAENLKLSKVLEKLWTHFGLYYKVTVSSWERCYLSGLISKMTHFVAIMEGTLAKGLVRLFRDNV